MNARQGEPDAVLRPGDRIRVGFDFWHWAARHPTAILTVSSITRTPDGVTILGLRWPPARDADGAEHLQNVEKQDENHQ